MVLLSLVVLWAALWVRSLHHLDVPIAISFPPADLFGEQTWSFTLSYDPNEDYYCATIRYWSLIAFTVLAYFAIGRFRRWRFNRWVKQTGA